MGGCLLLFLKARSTVVSTVVPILLAVKTSSPSLSTAGMGRLISSIRVNVTFGEKEERIMTTGTHIAADIFCVLCGSLVGWNYETAQEKSQKYKEGKSVLERFKISGPGGSSYWIGHDVHGGGSDADDA